MLGTQRGAVVAAPGRWGSGAPSGQGGSRGERLGARGTHGVGTFIFAATRRAPGLHHDPRAHAAVRWEQSNRIETDNGRSVLAAGTGLHAPTSDLRADDFGPLWGCM